MAPGFTRRAVLPTRRLIEAAISSAQSTRPVSRARAVATRSCKSWCESTLMASSCSPIRCVESNQRATANSAVAPVAATSTTGSARPERIWAAAIRPPAQTAAPANQVTISSRRRPLYSRPQRFKCRRIPASIQLLTISLSLSNPQCKTRANQFRVC